MSSNLTPIILLVVLGGFFYLFILRPQRRKQAETAQMQRTLGPGAEVLTTAGLYATVVDVADDVVTLEVSPGVTHRYVRAAISKVISTGPDDVSDEEYGDDAYEDDDTYDDDPRDAHDADEDGLDGQRGEHGVEHDEGDDTGSDQAGRGGPR